MPKRIWWVTGDARPEHDALFPKHWKQVLMLKEGDSEARLFIRGEAATPP